MNSYIDDIMGFDPQNLAVFNEPAQSTQNSLVYKTNPALSKSEDGNYRSRIRIIYNPFNIQKSIVHQATYAMNDTDGFFMVKSKLGNGDKSCPIFTSWKKLWFSNEPEKKEWAKKMYEKTESKWVLVQILQDDNQPELVGQFRVMKLPKFIYESMTSKMRPSPESKKVPVPIMDYLIGTPLDMEVTPGPDDPAQPMRKQREISYNKCEFSSDHEPIIKTDGTPLFDDDELETIEKYVSARNDMNKAKTEAKRQEKQKLIDELTPQIRPLYEKALEYVKANACDLVEECEFHEWDEATTTRVNRWIDSVAHMVDPKIPSAPAETPQPQPVSQVDPINDFPADDPINDFLNN